MLGFLQCWVAIAGFLAWTITEAQNLQDDVNGQISNLSNSRCINGFFLLNDECFKAVFSEPLRWEEARKACQSCGGDLATPRFTSSLQDTLQSLYGRKVFWVGATDQEREGDWRWVSGDIVDPDNWMPKQPNNCCGGEDCAVLGTQWSAPLNDNNCRNLRPYVCQMRALPLFHEIIAS